MLKMITITDSIDKKQWGEFIYNHPYGNIFQTPEMAEVYKSTKNYEPIILVAIDSKNDELLAFLQAVVIKEFGGFLRTLSSRSIIQGGPLLNKSENKMNLLKILMEHYEKKANSKAIYTQIRPIWDIPDISNFLCRIGYKKEEHFNFKINLNTKRDDLWQQLFKARRNGINRSKRLGVIIEELTDKSLIPIAYNLLKETYTNAKLPLADLSLFESIFSVMIPKNMAKIFLAKHNDIYIGVIVILIYKGVIFDWYAGSSREYLKFCPNDILPWHVMEWGIENGYQEFDFGGAGKPNEEYGVREFKKQFGGKLVNYGRYEKVHGSFRLKIAEKGFGVYRRFL